MVKEIWRKNEMDLDDPIVLLVAIFIIVLVALILGLYLYNDVLTAVGETTP